MRITKPFFTNHAHYLLLIWLCLFAGNLIQAQNFDSVEIKYTKLSNNIYMLEGRGGNIGLCTGNDGTFMIDDQYAPLTEKIKAAIAKLTSQPVQFIINTHWHGDHSGGNENFGKAGAIIVSQENSRRRMEANQFFGLPQHGQEAYASPGLPKITFTQSMTFHYNGETIQIFHLTNAHTDGDAIIWFRQSNIMHMGDVFVRYGFPFIDEPNGGNINGMIETIDYVLKEINDQTQVIPGHGQMSTKADLVTYNNMLKTVRDRVKKQMDEGKTVEDIIKSDPMAGFEKRGVGVNDFVRVVYNSLLKTKK